MSVVNKLHQGSEKLFDIQRIACPCGSPYIFTHPVRHQALKMRTLVLIVTAICFMYVGFTDTLHAQPRTVIFLPGKLITPPLTASHTEPRVGLRKEVGSSRMKVDIGASVEMLEFRPHVDSTQRLRIGIDFFTYALSTSSEGLRLQIDAVDGFFGGHVTYVNDCAPDGRAIVRLRLLHLSAHFLDGHFSTSNQTWKENRAPIPFTRDYGELLFAYEFGNQTTRYKPYAGFSYATLIRPTDIGRIELHAGIEFRVQTGILFSEPLNLYVSQYLTFRSLGTYIGTKTTEAGMKLGNWDSTGLKIYVSYFNGLDPFGQYYDVRRENVGIGFAFDFW